MRKKLVVANWKMNSVNLDSFVSSFKELVRKEDKVEMAIAPPFPYLSKLAQLLEGTSVHLAAQNAFWESKGAFTGEISLAMLKECGVSYVILGHSERRQFFGDTDQSVAKKVKACIENKMKAILCVGESLDERKSNQTFSVVERQVNAVLTQLANTENLVIAYEPVWAIGTGVTATVGQAQEVHSFIRDLLKKKFGDAESKKVQILYGGSMNVTNSAELLKQPDIDGGLVGGASLEAASFAQIVKSAF